MISRLKPYINEPLLHFLVIALLLWALVETFGRDTEQASHSIVVSDAKMVRFLQFQNKAFNSQKAQASWQAMSEDEKYSLSQYYVRQEVMVREALALGLDTDDQIIRQRLIQKIEYINTGFQSEIPTITEPELKGFFNDNKEDYNIEGAITFSHVFFSKKSHGKNTYLLAKKTLGQLNQEQVAFSDASKFGERFYFHRNYVDRTHAFVATHFGEAFTQAVFSLTADSIWHGPFRSEHGSHLVLLTKNNAGRTPELKEVAGQVVQDLQRIKTDQLKANALQKMLDKYQVNHQLKGTVTLHAPSTLVVH